MISMDILYNHQLFSKYTLAVISLLAQIMANYKGVKDHNMFTCDVQPVRLRRAFYTDLG